MTREEVAARLAEHQAAFEKRDADALAATHAPEGTFESPAHGVVQGREAIRGIYKYWYSGFPDFTFRWDEALIEAPKAAVFWTFEGTAGGPFFGDVKTGTHVKMQGAAQYTFSDEGIASVRHIFDFSQLLVSTGVLKIKPS